MAAIFSRKFIIFSFVHTKAKVTKFNLGEKWVKVNPRSEIGYLAVLAYTMLHTMFQGHQSSGSGEVDF